MHFPWAISLSPVLCVGMVCGQDKQERGLSSSGTKLGGRGNLRSPAETATSQSRAGEVWPGGREPREATQAGNHAECKAPGFPLKPVRSQGSEEVKVGTPSRGHPPFSVKRKWGPKVTWQPRACARWDAPQVGGERSIREVMELKCADFPFLREFMSAKLEDSLLRVQFRGLCVPEDLRRTEGGMLLLAKTKCTRWFLLMTGGFDRHPSQAEAKKLVGCFFSSTICPCLTPDSPRHVSAATPSLRTQIACRGTYLLLCRGLRVPLQISTGSWSLTLFRPPVTHPHYWSPPFIPEVGIRSPHALPKGRPCPDGRWPRWVQSLIVLGVQDKVSWPAGAGIVSMMTFSFRI